MADATTPAHAGAAGKFTISGLILAAVLAATFAFLLTQLPLVRDGQIPTWHVDWIPALGISLAFRIDGLSLLFGLLITGIGTLVVLYAQTYLAGHHHLTRLNVSLALFAAGMMGLVFADDLIVLFVFWEVTTISSYLLIGFNHEDEKARKSALQAMLVTGMGGLAMLGGLVLLGEVVGSFALTDVLASGDLIRDSALYPAIFVLVILGAFTKSAQVPFHFWLPNAMAAPTPVSAYLHSATMVKAGVFVLARLHPALSGTEMWFYTLATFGGVTAVLSSVWALRQTDLKLLLAWTTVMALGTLTMFLAADSGVAIIAAMTFLMVHALYKSSLFLVVGIIDHETGTRDLSRLSRLLTAMPVTAAAALMAGFAMAGFPPFLGFIGKELIYDGALAIADNPLLIAGAAVCANAMMVAAAGLVVVRPLLGRQKGTMPKSPHEAPWTMFIGPLLLATVGLLMGMLPGLLAEPLLHPAALAITGGSDVTALVLWHGVNLPLLLSIVTVTLGILLYLMRGKVRRAIDWFASHLPLTGERGYDGVMDGIKAFAAWQTRMLQSGSLTAYVVIMVSTFVLLMGGTYLVRGVPNLADGDEPLRLVDSVVVALAIAGTITAILARHTLLGICGLGTVGASVGLIFLFYGAIDVAMTQLLVETLFLVIMAAVLLRLPDPAESPRRPPRRRAADAVLSLAAGAVTSIVLLAVLAGPFDRRLTEYFETTSVPEAHGRNIVNVILVDFRALDTLGEITVVAIAGLAAWALLQAGRKGGKSR